MSVVLADALEDMDVDADQVENYYCVICGQSSPSTEDRPVGLVVLLQPSAGKRRRIVQRSPFFLSQPGNDAGAREGTGARCAAARLCLNRTNGKDSRVRLRTGSRTIG